MSTVKITPKSQLDGTLNAQFDCVPDCIDVAVAALTGQPFKGSPWWLSQGGYPPSYVGGTAAVKFVAAAKSLGVNLFAIDSSSNAQLVQDIHTQIEQGHPVVITEPDYLAPSHPDWSHVNLMYQDAPGSLTAMDPWGAKIVTKSDAEWASLLEFHEIWSLERIVTVATNVPKGWSLSSDKKTLTAPNGQIAVMGFKDKILNSNWDPANLILEREHGDGAGGTEQLCSNCMLTWNPKAGVAVQTLGVTVLTQRVQIDALQQRITALIAQVNAANQVIPPVVVTALSAALHSMADTSAAIQSALNAQPPAPPVVATKG